MARMPAGELITSRQTGQYKAASAMRNYLNDPYVRDEHESLQSPDHPSSPQFIHRRDPPGIDHTDAPGWAEFDAARQAVQAKASQEAAVRLFQARQLAATNGLCLIQIETGFSPFWSITDRAGKVATWQLFIRIGGQSIDWNRTLCKPPQFTEHLPTDRHWDVLDIVQAIAKTLDYSNVGTVKLGRAAV